MSIDPKTGCGHSKFWRRPETDPAHDLCSVHDEAYEDGINNVEDWLYADARFILQLWKRTVILVIESIVYPPIVLAWGAYHLLTKRGRK